MSQPAPIEVSVVTPTYNRRRFIPALIDIYRAQTYPKEKMEWIIIDDGRESVADLFQEAALTLPNVRYIRLEEKLRIGAKRNRLNDEARGAIIIAMDDDDYYPPDRIETIVRQFAKYPRVDLLGSSEMNMYYTDTRDIYTVGPFGQNHATNGTMAWRKRYSNLHRYDEYVTQAEELSFLENHKHPMIQMDPKKAILVICHRDNTVDKMEQRADHLNDPRNHPSKMRKSLLCLADIVKDVRLRSFYETLI
jgi:glycosyltransferase involved in cell wall biosynthesis